MEYVYAALLLHKVGSELSAEKIAAVLQAAGAKPDPARAAAIVEALRGIDIDKAIAAAAPVAPAAPAPAEEKKKEEKKKEEVAVAGLSALFG